ncbi:DUF1295 domain-containing protein [Mycobacterium sp. DL592]|uniref:DUF1295 domain-containing protein n=1 Tax=Mycobacterium sp. DL592 TaxID=2675524 RepID=UPI001423BB09|nr:DUF1295 domain-containing protein [Mycobacterium sp. DL592]
MSVHRSKAQSLLVVTVAYVLAIAAGAAWLVWGPSATGSLLLDAFIADVLATLVIFVFSRAYKNSSFYDAFWSVIPPLLLLYWWAAGPLGLDSVRCWLVTIVVVYWAIRLTGNWVYGFPGLHHEDWRYPLLRDSAGRWEFLADLFGIHLVPTVQVFLGMLPVYIAVTTPGDGLVWLSWVALVVGVAAVTLELVADTQMHRFVAAKQPGAVMDQGLWAWSRHPNYLGELGFWVSMALFGVAASPADWWWLFVGVAAMLAMFLGASIPLMEKRSLERRPHYQAVIDTVPKLIPRPPRKAVA